MGSFDASVPTSRKIRCQQKNEKYKPYIRQNIVLIILTIFFNVLPVINFAQESSGGQSQSSEDNYFNLLQQYEADIETNELDSAEDGFANKVARWQWFWGSRIGSGTEENNGDFSNYFGALQKILDEGPLCQNATNSQLNWDLLGPLSQEKHRQGRVDIVIADPLNSNRVYAGTNASGLWRCDDISVDTPLWINITDYLAMPSMGVIDFDIHPTNSNIGYVSLGYLNGVSGNKNFSVGLFKTTNLLDEVPTWSKILPENNTDVSSKISSFLIDKSSPQKLYAIINNQLKISNNGGNSFSLLVDFEFENPGDNLNITDLIIDKFDSNVLFIAGDYTIIIGNVKIRKAILWNCVIDPADGAVEIDDQTTQLNDNIELSLFYTSIRFAIGPNGTYAMYLFNDGSTKTEIKLYNNIQNTWDSFKVFSSSNTMAIFGLSPVNDNIFYIESGGRELKKTTSGGSNFINCTNYSSSNLYHGVSTHADIRGFFFIEGSIDGLSDNILCASDGGILHSTLFSPASGGYVKWKDINGVGLAITQFFGIGQRFDQANVYGGGCQDNGTLIYQTSQDGWIQAAGSDGYELLFNKNNPKYVLAQSINGPFIHSDDYGFNFWSNPISNDQINACKKTWQVQDQPVYNDRSDHTFLAYHDVYRSDDHGSNGSWSPISDFSNSNNVPENWLIESLVAYPGDNNIMYAAFSGETWSSDYTNVSGDCLSDDNTAQTCESGAQCPIVKKLFKTSEALSPNPQWYDITPNFNVGSFPPQGVIRYKGISDLAVSDSNPEVIFASFRQMSSDNGDITVGITRVTASQDGGDTWVDYSNGLPSFPINRLVFYNGSNNGLFAGNDLGVYYTDDDIYPINGWICVSDGLPPAVVSDIDINYCRQVIRISTFGRGIWEADLNTLGVETDLIVDQTATWDTPRDITGNITITNNARLTITSTIYMSNSKSITIEPGARLYVDGGTITNNCGGLWDGIYVEGNSNLNQYTSYQGYFRVRYGGTIENAYIGVRNYGLKANGDIDWNKTGGIISGYNSYFINNRWDAGFIKYQKFYTSGAPRSDKSGFFGCDFIDNDDFADDSSPARSISLDRVHNVKIKGCTFSDNRTDPDWVPENGGDTEPDPLPAYKASSGIEAGLCSFIVDNYLDSTTEFNNLKYGIKAYDYDAASIVIQNADFDCYKGIYLNGITDAKVDFNNFYVASENNYAGGDGVLSAYGVYLDMCINYQVEENSFSSNSADDNNDNAIYSSAYGVVVYNRHGEATKIYNNTFDNFYVATEAIGQNKNENLQNKIGLQFRCNNFSNDKYDVFVTPNFFFNPDPIIGIAYYQGEQENGTDKLAGNLFSNSSPNLQSNYLNNGDFFIYRHHKTSSNTRVRPYISSNIYLQQVITEQYNSGLSCPTQFGDGDDDDDAIIIAALKTTAEASADEVVVINTQLTTLVDGGNTEQLVNDVVLTSDEDAWEKYNKLKKNEGYLSEDVLLALSKKETGFSKAMIRNVLVGNPQSAKSRKVQQNLDNRGNQLPGYMRKQIDKGLTKMSAKENLEMAKTAHKTRHDHAINRMVRLLKKDTLNNRSAEIISALSNTGDISFDYKLVKYYDEHGQINNADILLDQVSSTDLNNDQQNFHEKYTDFRNLTAQWRQSGVDMAALDSTKIMELSTYAQLDNTVAAKAIALLQLNDANTYVEPIYLPEEGDKSNSNPKQERIVFNENEMLVFPNPADGYFTVEYNLSNPFNKAVLVVFDISGRVIEQLEIRDENDQLIIPVDDWPSGQYTISIFVNGKTAMTKKITISK